MSEVADKTFLSRRSPCSSLIARKYASSKEDKVKLIREAKNDRFITPATQYELRFLDSQNQVGGFEKMKECLD